MLIERSLQVNGGSAPIHFKAGGVVCTITLPLPSDTTDPLTAGDAHAADRGADPDAEVASLLAGKRILVVEDEPLIAMEIEAQLTQLGCTIVGPAGTIEAAEERIEAGGFDAALLDANIAGRRADPLAALLVRAGIPFAFATGYGRAGLPDGFDDAVVLAKPFATEDLKHVIRGLVAPAPMGAEIVSLKPNRA